MIIPELQAKYRFQLILIKSSHFFLLPFVVNVFEPFGKDMNGNESIKKMLLNELELCVQKRFNICRM